MPVILYLPHSIVPIHAQLFPPPPRFMSQHEVLRYTLAYKLIVKETFVFFLFPFSSSPLFTTDHEQPQSHVVHASGAAR